ncbi:MAG: translesion DNA synthesis-associated protein ImuA [Gammaproteobacteria bacterium]|nr:translesion DNA synthesis-associated protein ImuA [Gammaproteobacteria bacterium]
MQACEQIESLLRDQRLWQLGRLSQSDRPRLPSGWPALDRSLGGGWPLGELTELLVADHGIGELSLLLPALARLTQATQVGEGTSRWITLVAPPHIPYAPALVQSGLDLSHLLVVHARQGSDALWAIEQALHSRSCAAVVGWSDTEEETVLRRLQLAAEASAAWVVLFRSAHLRRLRSPAPLRIGIRQTAGGRRLLLDILKRRGGPPVSMPLPC